MFKPGQISVICQIKAYNHKFLLIIKIKKMNIYLASYDVISKLFEIRRNSIFSYFARIKKNPRQFISADFVFVRLSVINNFDKLCLYMHLSLFLP